MHFRFYTYCLLTFLAISFFTSTHAQSGLCPPNFDFETGDFTNWVCRNGRVSIAASGKDTIEWLGTGQTNERHTIIYKGTAGKDQYGGFPQTPPNGSGYSVRLGNNRTGGEAEEISYTFTIPASPTVFSLTYYFAVVLESPGHQDPEQPRFRTRIVDVATNKALPCVDFDFIASASLPGFKPSLWGPSIIYRDWTPITLNLRGYGGKTVRLEFITNDCTFGGHFGYAYLDVSSSCNGAIEGSVICNGDTSMALMAPYGFESYAWYSDNTFSQVIHTEQILTLAPLPTVGRVFPVIVTPYPGFGCKDTLYGVISVASKPVSVAGGDASICKYEPVQLGTATSTPGYSYSWIPVDQVSNLTIPNPVARPTTQDTTAFIVKTTDMSSGCYTYDTAIISTRRVDTTLSLSGKDAVCEGNPEAAVLSVTNAAAVQWYNDKNPISNAVASTHQAEERGEYWAELKQYGCTDSTRIVPLIIYPLPKVSFTYPGDTMCINSNPFLFTSTSVDRDNIPLNYLWKFSDGSIDSIDHVSKKVSSPGPFTAELVATTYYGCKDSASKIVAIMPNGVPDFSWDPACVNRPVLFTNNSNENDAPQTAYNWDFNNGGPGSVLKDPPPVVYTAINTVDAKLQLTTLGCEAYPQTVIKKVQVHSPRSAIRYKDMYVPQGNSKWIQVKGDAEGTYHWQPQIQLSTYDKQYTEFHATVEDVKYLIDITDKHTCNITDTLQMLVLKTPGFYLPNAFTPNGDGLNDVVKPYLTGMKSLKRFSVYNRWGNLVFSTTTAGEGWDGKYKGVMQATGIYVWVLEFVTNDDKRVTEKGTITIIK